MALVERDRADHALTVTLRRLQTVKAFTDAAELAAARALRSAAQAPDNATARARASMQLATFRKQLRQERRELAALEPRRSEKNRTKTPIA